jgi:hypothetical protein
LDFYYYILFPFFSTQISQWNVVVYHFMKTVYITVKDKPLVRWEVIVLLILEENIDHHCLNFLFISITSNKILRNFFVAWFTIKTILSYFLVNKFYCYTLYKLIMVKVCFDEKTYSLKNTVFTNLWDFFSISWIILS